MTEPVGGPPGPSPLLIVATICFVIACIAGLYGFSGNGGRTSPGRAVFWICGSLSVVMAYWDHEHRRFK